MKEIEQSRMSHVLVKGTCMMVPWEPRMELVVGNDQLIFGYEFDRSTTLKLFEFPGPCHFSSVQFSRLVVSHSLRPHESQHACFPVHHQLLEFTQTQVHRVSDALSILNSIYKY